MRRPLIVEANKYLVVRAGRPDGGIDLSNEISSGEIAKQPGFEHAVDIGKMAELDGYVAQLIPLMEKLLGKMSNISATEKSLNSASNELTTLQLQTYQLYLDNNRVAIALESELRKSNLEDLAGVGKNEDPARHGRELRARIMTNQMNQHSAIFQQHQEIILGLSEMINRKRQELIAQSQLALEQRQKKFQTVVSVAGLVVALTVGSFSIVNVLRTLGLL